MGEDLTFANYRLDNRVLSDVYNIGAEDFRMGVVPEISTAFDHKLALTPSVDNLGELISKVGPAKELQENIGRVQDVLGTDDDAVAIARGWVERSGLLLPVERSYVNSEQLEGVIELGVITGGVRNWMARRVERLIELNTSRGVLQALLVAGNRPMKATEGPDVEEGMTEADYMRDVVRKQIVAVGIHVGITAVESGVGDEVMEVAAEKAEGLVSLDRTLVAVVSNAGAWVQNAGQFRRAVRSLHNEKFDESGNQLLAVSDGFPLGTGNEPASTHQNPFSAVGQILRNAQELVRHES